MNIFQVLSQGKSRLHEPSMSAMLGYLLDSNKDHGLGDAFVREFLKLLNEERFNDILKDEFIDAQVSLEEPYQLNGNRKDIDIQLLLLDIKKNEQHRIIIENKIKVGAANPKQLNDYYSAVLAEEPEMKGLTFVFLTPKVENRQLVSEFYNLLIKNEYHSKEWIYWSSGDRCISSILKSILLKEGSGEINPINEYMRHTIKAFIRHNAMTTEASAKKTMRTGEDIGVIIEEVIITTQDGISYRVIRRDSTQIQVFNEDTGDKEIARRVLSTFIDEQNMPIDHSKLNTRSIGKQFFEMHGPCN
ncbi:PD-(D/E)XK nuclease family protein [Psychrosphaera sp. F3M07]|uniref:PD-(D/E)XK nuclease family protein n=1 Tax=Psychrosphaera sp. F3M07 TaxID=2841560 RepID=UPI001C0A3365|nr:PD-(D/E)XK nuclease family protein [Psychrosphaera sp. F3M07]MBU2916849.1 PD-(D/E)XK nuclease family protein [Psychrosphaera sp. F3M07]